MTVCHFWSCSHPRERGHMFRLQWFLIDFNQRFHKDCSSSIGQTETPAFITENGSLQFPAGTWYTNDVCKSSATWEKVFSIQWWGSCEESPNRIKPRSIITASHFFKVFGKSKGTRMLSCWEEKYYEYFFATSYRSCKRWVLVLLLHDFGGDLMIITQTHLTLINCEGHYQLV